MQSVFLIPFIVAAAVLAGLLFARWLLLKALHSWAEQRNEALDKIYISTFGKASVFWCLAIAAYAGVRFSVLAERSAALVSKGIYVLVLISVTLVLANLSGRLFRYYVERSGLPIPTTGLTFGLVKGAVLVLGTLMVLNAFGIAIAPLVTALGLGGLAVALALKDTLENLFAGLQILIEKPVKVGDFIKLESGEEGYVQDIGLRTTRVRLLPNNMVIIPNSKITQSVLTNYYLPVTQMALLIPVSVSYGSDPEKVERVLVEEAKKGAGEIPGLLGEPEPFVRFIPGFGESSLDFTLICQVREFVDQYLAQHELRKRIFRRFKEEGIEIPFPHRTVYLKEGKGGAERS